jgi:flavin reductase (DIM6/NTAB) family NADH-FMN oxidoreductase RutF
MLDQRSFRQMMGCFATGVAVITLKREDGTSVGLTINSLTSVSLDPPMILFCIDKKAHLYPPIRASQTFAVNFLGEGQEPVSRYFADRHHSLKPKSLWDKPQDDCPILRQTLGWLICRKSAVHKGGDHDIFLGEVTKLHKRSGPRDPLLYFHGRYRGIGA